MALESDAAGTPGVTPIDRLILDLQRRRAEAGSPSYAEIASRIERRRVEAGAAPFEAKPSRSTVYDLFRVGRRRIDIELFLDVIDALGADAEERAQWQARARQAVSEPVTAAGAPFASPESPASPTAPEVGVPSAEDAGNEVALVRLGSGPRLQALRGRQALILMLCCWALNMAGMLLTKTIPIELFLDMTGTAITALLVGPWAAVPVGLATNLGEAYLTTWHGALFGLANAAGGLVWGYGVRRGLGATILRYLVLNVLVAFVVSTIATVIIVPLYHGYTGHGSDSLVHAVVDRGHSLVMSVFSTNMLTSLQDKLLAGFVALIVAEWMALRQGAESTKLPLGR